MTGTPTRITSLGVVPCYQHGGHGTVIGTALEEFCLTVNESGLLFSWYLREAGGVPARHQELTIVARDDPAEVVNSSEFSPMDWDFEQMDALVDFSISCLADNQRESAALSWLPTAVHAQARRWGSSTEPLDRAYRAATAGNTTRPLLGGGRHAALPVQRVGSIRSSTGRRATADSTASIPGVSDPSGTILPTPRRDGSALYIRSLLML